MAARRNSSNKSQKVEYTDAEIRSRAAGEQHGGWVPVRCLNGRAHQHGDRNPSASYNLETGFYQCFACALRGYASDRDRPDWRRRQARTYPNGSIVHRMPTPDGKKIWQENPQPSERPYQIELLHAGVDAIYIVEGEKCAEALTGALGDLPRLALTSIGGSQAAGKTDWSAVRTHLRRHDCVVVFIPDRDVKGEWYMQDVANKMDFTELNVIRLGGERADGYDVADWLEEGNRIQDLPEPEVESLAERTPKPHGYRDLFGYREHNELAWIADNVLPAGKLILIVGRSGIGKSTMALYIVSAVSNGIKPFTEDVPLRGELFDRTDRVLIYTSEDDWNDTVAVRLDMMDATLDNIAPLRSQRDGVAYSFDWSGRRERDRNGNELPSDLDLLLTNLRREPVTLLVVDPLLDVVSGGSNNDPSVIRRAIETKINPLLEAGCTVIGVHHERKDARADDLLVDRAIGSQAWTGVARSVLHMQALTKRKALGRGRNPKPRASMDGRFNIAQVDMGTNSDVCGVLVVSKSNLAKVDGGYHYELPTSVPDGQTSSFIQVAVNPRKITNRTPEELIQIYNPIAQEEPPESPVNRHARMTMAKEISALEIAKSAVRDAFSQSGRELIPSTELIEIVRDGASVGVRNAKEAIREMTESVRSGKRFSRRLKNSTDR